MKNLFDKLFVMYRLSSLHQRPTIVYFITL